MRWLYEVVVLIILVVLGWVAVQFLQEDEHYQACLQHLPPEACREIKP